MGDRMKMIFKRLAAYIIDIMLISLVIAFIAYNPYINMNYNKYNEVYDEYENYYDSYNKSLDKLKDDLNNEVITNDDYDKELTTLNKSYIEESLNYRYRLDKLSTVTTFLTILTILLYFVVIQYAYGTTIGKKLLKIKIVSNNDKPLTLLNYFIRSLLLYGVVINTLNLIFIIILSKSNYIIYSDVIYIVSYIIETAIAFSIIFTKNNRGIHDMISNTKVVEVK